MCPPTFQMAVLMLSMDRCMPPSPFQPLVEFVFCELENTFQYDPTHNGPYYSLIKLCKCNIGHACIVQRCITKISRALCLGSASAHFPIIIFISHAYWVLFMQRMSIDSTLTNQFSHGVYHRYALLSKTSATCSSAQTQLLFVSFLWG